MGLEMSGIELDGLNSQVEKWLKVGVLKIGDASNRNRMAQINYMALRAMHTTLI